MAFSLKGFSLSGLAQALTVINAVAPPETAAVVNVIPGGVGTETTGDIVLAETSLALLTNLINALAAAKATSPAPVAAPVGEVAAQPGA